MLPSVYSSNVGGPDDRTRERFVDQLDWTLGHKLPAYPLGSPFQQAQHYKSIIYLGVQTLQRVFSSASIDLEKPRKRDEGKAAPGIQGTDNRYVPMRGHPLSDVLRHPNPATTFSSFLSQCALQYHLHGRLVIWGRQNQVGAPIRLYVLPTPLVNPAFGLGNEEYPVGAWWVQTYYPNTGMAGVFPWGTLPYGATLDAREVYVLDNPHPLYTQLPYSPLVGEDVQLDLVEMIDRSCWSVMQNGVEPSGIIDAPGANEATINAMQSRINNRFAGVYNKGRVMVLGGGDPDRPSAKWQGVTPSSRDMMHKDVAEWYTGLVLAAVFGLDLRVVGLRSEGGYAERWAAEQGARMKSYEPFLANIANLLTDKAVPKWGLEDRGIRVNISLPKMQDPTLIAGMCERGARNSTMSTNEIRAADGLEPVEGGELPPKLFEQWLAKQKGIQDQPQPPMPGVPGVAAKPDIAAKPDTDPAEAERPRNPNGEGSLPERTQSKAMSAYSDSSGGVLVGEKKRVVRGKKAKRILDDLVCKALGGTQ